MKDESILEKGQLRMLEVDNPLLLPIDTHIRFVITAADVLHDWALPSLSLKVDACPGYLRPVYYNMQLRRFWLFLMDGPNSTVLSLSGRKYFLLSR
jgi:hypothetical protein